MAPGGHSNRLSCCCNKVYFLLKHLVLCLRLSGWRSRLGRGGAGPGRAALWRPGLRAGVGRAQVELPTAARKPAFGSGRVGSDRIASGRSQFPVEQPGGGGRAATMRCCRVCAFGKLYGFHPHLWSHGPKLGLWPRPTRLISAPPPTLQMPPEGPGG